MKALFWLVSCFALGMTAMGQTPASSGLPFTLTWVKGKCSHCQVGWWLDDVVFTSGKDAWATGANGPAAGFEGMGYRVLLHTMDGGHRWEQVPGTELYNSPTLVAFLDAKNGWIEIEPLQLPGEGSSLLETHNGGASWKKVNGKFPVFPVILDATHWWGLDFPDTLMQTADAGRSWTRTSLPNGAGKYPTTHFLSPEIGWTCGVDNGQFVSLRTTDGGKSWEKSLTGTPKPPLQLRDLTFLDRNRGLAVLDYNLRGPMDGTGSYVFATTDGGKTWKRQVDDALLTGTVFWAQFLSERLGFVYLEDPGKADKPIPTLLYSTDSGAHWRKTVLPYFVSGCQALQGDFLCSAQEPGADLILLKIHPK